MPAIAALHDLQILCGDFLGPGSWELSFSKKYQWLKCSQPFLIIKDPSGFTSFVGHAVMEKGELRPDIDSAPTHIY